MRDTQVADDCRFTAATLGLPKLLREEDVQTEYPSDTDDEYVTERGFQPTLPGEYTRLSSALALFRGTRILSRVLEKNYPAAPTHELSLQQMSQMENDLNEWYDDLPTHLRLNFVQDKPSTDVTGSRSPLIVSCIAWHTSRYVTNLGRHWHTTISALLFIVLPLALVLVPRRHPP